MEKTKIIIKHQIEKTDHNLWVVDSSEYMMLMVLREAFRFIFFGFNNKIFDISKLFTIFL
jgi:hypothetical protein